MKIYDFFLKKLRKKPNSIFLSNENTSYTYKDLHDLIVSFEKCDFKGSYITIIRENSVYFFALYLLCSKINKTLVTLDHNSNFEILKKQIIEFKLNNILCSDKLKQKLISEKVKKNFLKESNNFKKKNINKKEKKNEIFLLTFSSGSTSLPKPIAISEKTKIDRANSNINIFSVKKEDKIIISTPLHHTLAIRLMTMGIILGSEIVFLQNYSLEKFLKTLKRKNCQFTFFVSNQLSEITKNKSYIKLLKPLKCLVSSSSKLPLDEKNELIKFYNKKIYEIYGLSEAAVVSNLDLKKNKLHVDSVGKPIPGVKVKINYFKNKKFGEIAIKSKYLCLGYYLNNKIKRLNKNKFFKTGDIGYIKGKFIYFAGRIKNMVKINGISVYLEDIENILKKNKVVNECVVLPIYSLKNINPRICLLFSKLDKSESYVRNYCYKKLPPYQLPTYIYKINKIPRNKMGKLNMIEIKKFIDVKTKIQ